MTGVDGYVRIIATNSCATSGSKCAPAPRSMWSSASAFVAGFRYVRSDVSAS